jgi:predicted nucleic acid-binding Zn ribbon protein
MQRKCEKCGEVIEDDSLFCSKCGTYVRITENSKSYSLKWIVVALIAVSLILAAGIFITNYNSKIDTTLAMTSDSDLDSFNTYSVQLKDGNGKFLSDEFVTVQFNNQTYNLKTDSNGTASINLTVTDGSFEISSNYKGNDVYKESHTSDIVVK